ncbi:hypothetical protein GF337_08805, partial [candidate division KSB1 bacterium]|nr:hypothetical protein [candidate division KSB1 bacterium]
MMTLKKIIYIFIGLLFMGAAINSQAQEFHVGNHPELKWYTIETKHFMVHYHKGAERTARVVAKIAEDIYLPITSLYLYEPDDKIHFVIRDHDDFSNGAAFYYDNKVEIWATPMDFMLRGSHNWLRNVVTHEFTHMISLGAARKMSRSIPAIYMQYIDYEPEKNPYVLYGFPNKIVSYPIAMTIVPMWLAEGMAQFQLPGLNYDRWDSHRDMILRDATLEGELLDHKEMAVFGDNSIRNEKSYNQGYSLTQYIVDQYGLESLRRIVREMKSPFRFSVNGAIKNVLNISERQLYKDWKTYLEKMYDYRTERIQTNLVTGEVLRDEGSADIYPIWSPDGKRYAFLSNEDEKSISKTSLYVHDTESNKTKKIKDGVLHSVNWSPDGTKLIYTKYSDATKYLSHYLDIFAYDLKKEKERPITRYYRAQSPAWSPDGKSMVFVVTKDGTQNLVKLDLETKKPQYLTKFKNGEQIFTPRWAPNGNAIIVSLAERHKRNIALISADSGKIHYLIRDKYDARDPIFSPDGEYVYFSWDRTGIFNIYRMDARGKNVKQLTNVLGGAFMPSVNKNGQLLYSGFSKQKYNIFQLDKPEPIDQIKTEYVEYQRNFHLASTTLHEILPLNENKADITTRSYDDTQIPSYESKPYSNYYSKMAILPRIMIDYETTKLGTYFYSSDILDNYSVFGGVAANKDFDLDVFGIFEYRKFLPTFFLEGYYQIRHHSQMDSLILQDEFLDYRDYTNFDFKYNLMEVDLGMESYIFNELNKFRLAYIYSRYSTKVKYNILNQESTDAYTYFKGSNISLTYTFT